MSDRYNGFRKASGFDCVVLSLNVGVHCPSYSKASFTQESILGIILCNLKSDTVYGRLGVFANFTGLNLNGFMPNITALVLFPDN